MRVVIIDCQKSYWSAYYSLFYKRENYYEFDYVFKFMIFLVFLSEIVKLVDVCEMLLTFNVLSACVQILIFFSWLKCAALTFISDGSSSRIFFKISEKEVKWNFSVPSLCQIKRQPFTCLCHRIKLFFFLTNKRDAICRWMWIFLSTTQQHKKNS